jgi:hypothetical protein
LKQQFREFAMAKADRLARIEVRRVELEAEYNELLVAALRTTAAGHWGLFDHNSDRWTRASINSTVENLNQVGEAIDVAREQLGMPPYELHQQFLASRGPVGPQAVGEPKQAQAWLDRLAESMATKA